MPQGISISDDSRCWLALSRTQGLGHVGVRRLIARLGSVAEIFRASLTELESVGVTAPAAQSLALGASLKAADEVLNGLEGRDLWLITPASPEYPEPLANIYDPPMALYGRGAVEALSAPGIAVVGTRHPTPYGVGMAERLSCDLAARGLVIFSGLARGVDAAAHRGALQGRGRTVAIFGTGVDVVYPRENLKLAGMILDEGGALLSEFPLGQGPRPENFPIRNRIISGLSYGVLVGEAGEYSGTRITARCALEQGREVFAIPGNVTNKLSWGPNTLIKQGAHLTATWEDLWEELPNDLRLRLQPIDKQGVEEKTPSLFGEGEGLQPKEKKLYACLRADEATQIDELMSALEGELSSAEVFSILFELELAGKIRQLPGKNYVRVF
jgi:DNA processing protein